VCPTAAQTCALTFLTPQLKILEKYATALKVKGQGQTSLKPNHLGRS